MIRQEFLRVSILNDIGMSKTVELTTLCSAFLDGIEKLVPPGRERALVVTKLQELAFFADRGIALDPANHKA